MNLVDEVVSVVTIVVLVLELELLEELLTQTPLTAVVSPGHEVPQYELLIST
jgi:hypothetical protein